MSEERLHQYTVIHAEGKLYLFYHSEYDSRDYEDDMARLALRHPNREWLDVTNPKRVPLSGESS